MFRVTYSVAWSTGYATRSEVIAARDADAAWSAMRERLIESGVDFRIEKVEDA